MKEQVRMGPERRVQTRQTQKGILQQAGEA